MRYNDLDRIDDITGCASGDRFDSPAQVRAYFQQDELTAMGFQDRELPTQDDLDGMAERIIETGFHCDFPGTDPDYADYCAMNGWNV